MDFFPGPLDPAAGEMLIAVEYDRGAPFIHLLRIRTEAEGGGSELLWCCELVHCCGLIRQLGWSNAGSCVFGDAFGCFYLLDFRGRQCRLLKHYKRDSGDVQGTVRRDGGALMVLFERHDDFFLQELSLQPDAEGFASPAIELDLYDDDCFGGGFDYRDENEPCFELSCRQRLYPGPGNSLILHCVDKEYDSESGSRVHFQYLLRIDLAERGPRYRVYPLATPPQDWHPEREAIAICAELGLAALPILMPAEATEGGVALGIEWVDLDSGNRSVPVWVRRYPHFGDEKSATGVLQSLSISLLYPDEQLLWLGWEDGSLRCVGLDGSLKSPLLQAPGQLLRAGPSLLFDCRYSLARSAVPEAVDTQLEQSAGLKMQVHDWRHNWQPSPQQQWLLNRLGRNCIRVDDLDDPSERLAALMQLQQLTLDCAALRRDRTIALLFEDGRQQWNEARFFEQAARQVEAHPVMARVLDNFSEYANSEGCMGEDYKPPLADCALQLGLQDAFFLPVIRRYLFALDNDHDGFFVGEGDGLYQLQCRHEQDARWQEFFESQPYYECYEEDWEE
ncbi:hypothetical protein [Microbulbifer taiwanensis]|nr:hypothetical protein [Microbulbifer taiwanensis]